MQWPAFKLMRLNDGQGRDVFLSVWCNRRKDVTNLEEAVTALTYLPSHPSCTPVPDTTLQWLVVGIVHGILLPGTGPGVLPDEDNLEARCMHGSTCERQ